MKYLRNAILALVALGPHQLLAPPDPNAFAHAYNTWVAYQQLATPGILNAREVRAWEETKQAWPEFKRIIDGRY